MRAKLTIESVTLISYGEKVKFNATYSENKEDNSYASAMPSANAEFQINNPELLGVFKPNQQFYVDFTPITPEAK